MVRREIPSNSERKSKLRFKWQIAGRLASIVSLMPTMGVYGDIPADQNLPSVNYSQSELMPSQELFNKEIVPVDAEQYCLYISGATGTNAGIRGIKEGLEQQYGVGKVEAFNSILNFEDPQNPKRFEQMADFIQSHSRKGLDIIAHSLGTAELQEVIEVLKKRDKNFFDKKENVENLHIILISPSGFSKGIDGPLIYLSRLIRYARSQVDLGLELNSPHRGIDALTAFPPEGITSEDLAVALRKAMPELSQLKADFPVETLPLVTERDYSDKLTDFEKEQIKTYSDMMKIAIASQNYDGLRHLIIKYGENLKEPLKQVYAGSFESADAQAIKEIHETVLGYIGGYMGILRVAVDGFGSEPMKEIAKLQKKGVTVYFIVPEYDIILPLNEAIEFFDGSEDASSHIKIAEGVAHAFPALQKNRFGEMVKDLGEDKSP
jgi:hypothetical protein